MVGFVFYRMLLKEVGVKKANGKWDAILYQFNPRYNHWLPIKELGQANGKVYTDTVLMPLPPQRLAIGKYY